MTPSDRAPGGVALAPGEAILIDGRFMYSTIAFFVHTELALTDRRFIAARPSTIFGLIPVGTSRSSYPIENIAGVSAGTRFDILGVIFGAVAIVAGLSVLGLQSAELLGALLGLLLVVLGAAAIIGSPKQYVEVMNSGGGAIRFPVSVIERGATLEFASQVSEAIARSTTPMGRAVSGTQSARPPADVDTAGALRQLDQLRSDGLVTEGEYADKRRDILARL